MHAFAFHLLLALPPPPPPSSGSGSGSATPPGLLYDQDPNALELLRKHAGSDLSELKDAVLAVLDVLEDQDGALEWNSSFGDNALIACLKDIVDTSGVPGGDAAATCGGRVCTSHAAGCNGRCTTAVT